MTLKQVGNAWGVTRWDSLGGFASAGAQSIRSPILVGCFTIFNASASIFLALFLVSANSPRTPPRQARDGQNPTALDRFLAEAAALDVAVEYRDPKGVGTICVKIEKPRDTRTRVLIRKLIEIGFKPAPDQGYQR